ncbi:TOM1-like protein 2 [Sycon ciliatum]|uniref:TOM1-like protein 2 n=1 Tax=Sycon ciliatum TaxID=27933 RepID=UPI0031F69EF6
MASLFSGAFSTPVGALIERSTKEDGDMRNDGINRAICYEVTSTDEGPGHAVKALKKRLFNNKNWRIVLNALSLLELLSRECGRPFQVIIAQREFLQSLVNLTVPKANSPTVVRDFVLLLIQKWAHDYENVHELVTICAMYETLKQKGTDFPSRELSELTPILSLQRTGSDSPLGHRHTPAAGGGSPSLRQSARRSPSTPQQQRSSPVPQAPAPVAAGAVPSGPVQPSTQQETKMRAELNIVRTNTDVLKALLDELTPGQEAIGDFQLLQDLNSTCRTMRSRIVELIDRISHDELICELLGTNDHLNNAFMEYDAYMARRNAAGNTQPAAGVETVAAATTPSVLAAPPSPSVQRPPQAATATADTGAGVSLIDMDATGAPPTQAMGGLNLDPFAQPPPQPADDDDDFDMFAQSRGQSTAAPAVNQADTSRNPFASDIATGGGGPMHAGTAAAPVSSGGPVTSSEFDDFLARRTNIIPATTSPETAANLYNPSPPVTRTATQDRTHAPSPSHLQQQQQQAVPSQDANLQDLLAFAAPASQATMQTAQNPVPGGRPAMQTHDPTADMFGF